MLFFPISTHEASWRHNLKPSDHAFKYNPLPKLLGVTYDRQLTFASHAATVSGKLRRQPSALRCLFYPPLFHARNTHDRLELRQTNITGYLHRDGRLAVEYKVATWLLWVSSSTTEKLEKCQRFAGRSITGQVKTTPVEAILAEANLPKIGTKATQLCAIALKKSKRIAPKNPRHQIAEQSSHQRTKKPSWRTKARAVWESIFGNTSFAKKPKLFPP